MPQQMFSLDSHLILQQMQSGYALHEVITDQQGKVIDYLFLDVNPAFERVTGLAREKVVGRRVLSVFPEIEPIWIERYGKVALTGEPDEFESYSSELNKHFQVTAFSPGKNLFAVLFNDVTSLFEKNVLQQQSEQRAQLLYRQLEALLDAIDDPICLVSRQFELLWANQGYRDLQKVLGCDQNGLVFRRYFDDDETYPVRSCFTSGEAVTVAVRTDDHRTWQLRMFPMLEKDQVEQVLLVATDFSEKEQLQEETARSSRLASLGLLATGIAHEINNPNAFVLYNSDMLQGVFADLFPVLKEVMADRGGEYNGLQWEEIEQELPQMLAAIQEGALRIKRIVGELRDYAFQESSSDFAPLDLNGVALAAVRLVDNTLKKCTYDFRLDLADELPVCHGDFGRLEQVVINLLLNSCQALTDSGQRIWLKTFYDVDREELVLQVGDEGQGIDKTMLGSLTEPFATTKGATGGTGLGLSVSTRIVKEHGGRLDFYSQPGQGTSVSMILPIPNSEDAN